MTSEETDQKENSRSISSGNGKFSHALTSFDVKGPLLCADMLVGVAPNSKNHVFLNAFCLLSLRDYC